MNNGRQQSKKWLRCRDGDLNASPPSDWGPERTGLPGYVRVWQEAVWLVLQFDAQANCPKTHRPKGCPQQGSGRILSKWIPDHWWIQAAIVQSLSNGMSWIFFWGGGGGNVLFPSSFIKITGIRTSSFLLLHHEQQNYFWIFTAFVIPGMVDHLISFSLYT